MLILSRKYSERIIIDAPDGSRIAIMVTHIDRGKIRLGLTAPKNYAICREELHPDYQKGNDDGLRRLEGTQPA